MCIGGDASLVGVNGEPLKRCGRCGEWKPLSDFFRDKTRASQYQSYCKRCKLEARRINREKRWHKAVDSLGGRCIVCGYKSTVRGAFDFHHLDPSLKRYSISQLLADDAPWERIERELNLCVLLCPNCHRLVHAGALDIGKYYLYC